MTKKKSESHCFGQKKKEEDKKKTKNESDRVQTSDAFWRSARELVFHESLFHVLGAIVFKLNPKILFFNNSTFVLRTDRRTDNPF